MGQFTHQLEQLETRRLLSAAIQLHDGTLIVNGTRRADEIVVQSMLATTVAVKAGEPVDPSAAADPPRVLVTINGRQRILDARNIRGVRVAAGAGDDRVIMHNFITLGFPDAPPPLSSTLLGGDGNDTLTGGSAADLISGGAGRDSIDGEEGNDTLDGDANSDTINGSAGKDLLRGGTGDDRFTMDENDKADGGADTDFFYRRSSGGSIMDRVDPNVRHMEGFLENNTDAPSIHFRKGVLVVEGTRRSDQINVNFDPLTKQTVVFFVNGRVVRHIPLADVKAIRIEGGNGDDSISIGPESTENTGLFETALMDFPLQLFGGDGNDTLIAALGDDRLMGGAGNDVLAGSEGNDSLYGGIGDDTLRGNDGNDTVIGNAGIDQVAGGAGVDLFQSPTDMDSERSDFDPGVDRLETVPDPGVYLN